VRAAVHLLVGRDHELEAMTILNFRIHQDEDGFFVGECEDLGVSSFGVTLTEAMDATMEAAEAYLEAIDDLGEQAGLR
jgi:predicted RNase H-like HicB family nuclease